MIKYFKVSHFYEYSGWLNLSFLSFFGERIVLNLRLINLLAALKGIVALFILSIIAILEKILLIIDIIFLFIEIVIVNGNFFSFSNKFLKWQTISKQDNHRIDHLNFIAKRIGFCFDLFFLILLFLHELFSLLLLFLKMWHDKISYFFNLPI